MMANDRLRILFADDEPTSRLLMQATLEKFGFEVCLAVDGEDALRQFRANPCDMVMLDVEMPGMDGYRVCAAVRAEAGDALPIVMVTGMEDVDSIEHAYESGATDFIAKPINWNLIGHRVRYLWRAYRTLLDLRTANARNAAIIRAIPDTLFRLRDDDLVLDTHAGPSDRPHPLPGHALVESFPADVVTAYLDAVRHARASGQDQHIEYQLGHDDGTVRYSECRIAIIDAHETLCLLRDITARKEAENRIVRLAYFDSLTGLPNRQSFLERLDREIHRTRYSGDKLTVLFMDLDGFKNVNDTMGHGCGDLILQWTADRLRQGIRPSDLVARAQPAEADTELARLGGDEFTVMIPGMAQSAEALVVAHRIRELMRRPFNLDGREVVLTASIGIAIYPDDGESAAALLKHADTAMYHAKDQGRDNCQFYRASLTEQAMQRLNLENNLRLALERGEFFLVYQPQLDLESGRILSAEVLIRWQHPEQGSISPMEFIPLAEENGLIVPIGDWVLRTACADAARWRAAGQALRVAVNLSPRQFKNPDLVQSVLGILDETGLPPALLELEVTEGALMEDNAATLATLNALRKAGIQLSLDDFGTGYSSLSYLKRMPLNNLKVDRSFVLGLPDDQDSLAIVRAIVSLAKNLGFTVTAEGVETLEQARILKELNCEILQGYYFSRPIPAGDIPATLSKSWPLEA